MKNNKGITLIALIVTILVIFVIIGISVTGGGDTLQKSKMTEYIGFMKLVKARADVVLEDEMFNGNSITTGFEIDINDVKNIDDPDNTSFNDKIDSYNGKKFIKWGGIELAAQGIDNSILNPGDDGKHDFWDENQEYFVIIFDENTYKTVDIIYSTGCGFDGDTYYTLTDMEDVINQ